MSNPIKEELRKSGAPPQKRQIDYEGDDVLFKSRILDPVNPVYYEEQKWTNPDDPDNPIIEIIKRGQLVSTHALGNLTAKEVRGINSFMNVSRICERFGYFNIAADIYAEWTQRVVASQDIEFVLGRALLTESHALFRQEQYTPLQSGDETKTSNPFAGIVDKIKGLDKKKNTTNEQGT